MDIGFAEELQSSLEKKPRYTVTVTVNNVDLRIGVGPGKQTFKWLAKVIESRLRASQVPNNKESRKTIVSALLNEVGEMLDPRQQICEHAHWLNGNWNISATTCANFPSDPWGNPIYDEWMATAYMHNDENFRWAVEMESWRSRLCEFYDVNGRPIHIEGKQQASNMIQIGGKPDVNIAFELDWQVINNNWEEWLPQATAQEDRKAIKNALIDRYDIIIEVFIHYCGTGELGKKYGMTRTELMHLLFLSKVYVPHIPEEVRGREGEEEDEPVDPLVLKNAAVENSAAAINYLSAICRRIAGSVDTEVTLLSRAHLTMALVCVAANCMNTDEKNIEAEIGEAFISRIASAIMCLLDDHIAPAWQRVLETYTLYQHLSDEVFVTSFYENFYILRDTFRLLIGDQGSEKSWGANSDEMAPKEAISVDVLMHVLKRSLFLGSTMSDELQECACLQALLKLQFYPPGKYEFGSVVFSEFLEIVATVGLVAIDEDSFLGTSGKRLRLAFNIMAGTAPAKTKGSDPKKSRK